MTTVSQPTSAADRRAVVMRGYLDRVRGRSATVLGVLAAFFLFHPPLAQGLYYLLRGLWPLFRMGHIGASSATDTDIWLARYDASGNPLGTSFVNTDTNQEIGPSISMDSTGNAVVAYQEFVGRDYGIYANRVSSTPSSSCATATAPNACFSTPSRSTRLASPRSTSLRCRPMATAS